MITLTIPNDDHIALRAFGKALEEMALAHGAQPVQLPTHNDGQLNKLLRGEQTVPFVSHTHGEVDTTAQQVESLGATHIITERKLVGDPIPLGDGNFSQGYIATVEEIADPVDSTDTPWDERIHSASKALNTDGTWRLRRKPKDMDEAEWAALVESVKAELSGATFNDPEFVAGFDDGVKDFVTGEVIEPPALYAPKNYVYMYRAADNIYGLAKSDTELADFEADGYVRHTQEQYDAWEGPNTTNEGDDHHTDADVVTEQTVAGIPPIPVPPPVVTAWTFPKLMTFLTERHGKIDVATVNTLLAQDGLASLQELNAHPDKIGPFVARVKAHLGE